MGQKVNPKSFRLAVNRKWDSRYFATKHDFPKLIEADYKIRKMLKKKLRYAAVPKVRIERAGKRVRITIETARPGVVIGRKGQELEALNKSLCKIDDRDYIIDIEEIKRPDLNAQLVAENVALQLERRISFRRAMKKSVQTTMSLGAEGIFIQCSGRLGGAEIARTEKQTAGRTPRQTLRENLDYGFAEAQTIYGKIGIKCWICLKREK